MKYKVFLLLVLFVVSFNQLSAQEKPVKFIPEKPQPGTEVTIKFNAGKVQNWKIQKMLKQ